MIGTRFGDWIIDAELGANEMGRLYRAHAADDPQRHAALKWLTHPKAKTPEFEKHFLAQIDLLRKLKHPSIVAVLDGGMYNGVPFYVMEWIEGDDYQTFLRRGGKPDWREALAAALQIVPALRYAHRRSVLHRDLKPANLFHTTDGTWKLSNFGVTKFFGDALLTNADNLLGSAGYLSPEGAAGKPHTKRSEFYALGCLLYTMIVGRPPFAGATVVELIHKHCFVLPERPLHFVADLPEEFDRFTMKLLVKDPGQRPGSGTLLIHEIESIWSALERRGLLTKKPAVVLAPDEEQDAAADEESPASRHLEPVSREPLPWQKRWYVIVPAFTLVTLLLLWAFYWRGPSADELMAKARPLLASEKPADWEKAWNDYLEPLSRKFPDKYVNEVREAKQRMDEQGELRRAFLTGGNIRYQSDAERFYHLGVRFVQAGEHAAARRLFLNLIEVYKDSKDEERWVILADDAVQRIDKGGLALRTPSINADLVQRVGPMIDEVRRLRRSDKKSDKERAERLRLALEALYRDEPEATTLRELLSPVKD